jgi:hypothetical protein
MAPETDSASLVDKLLARIYNQKVLFASIALITLAIVLFLVDHYLSSHPSSPSWLFLGPWRSLADACFVASTIGFLYEWIVRDEAQRRLIEGIDGRLDNQTRKLHKLVRQLLLADPTILVKTTTPTERRRILEATMQVELGDDVLGAEIYQYAVRRALDLKERWQNYRCAVTLTSIVDTSVSAQIRDAYFHCYYDIKYDTVLKNRPLSFSCVATVEEYNTLLADPACEMCWLFPTIDGGAVSSQSAFSVRDVRIGGNVLALTMPPGEPTSSVRYVADHPDLARLVGTVVTVEYHVDVRVKRTGHQLFMSLVYPTKRISMELDVTGTDIVSLAVRDFFASDKVPTIRYVPNRASAKKITVDLDDWVFPKGGVVFVWALASEKGRADQRGAFRGEEH